MRINSVMPCAAAYSTCISRNRKSNSFSRGMTPQIFEEMNDLKVFNHHIYEYEKGLRSLILTTEKSKHRDAVENKLKSKNIDYLVQDISDDKMNVFFGEKECIGVVKSFNNDRLNTLSPEQDFMLGIMLGYDKVKQCSRYLDIKAGKIKLGVVQE